MKTVEEKPCGCCKNMIAIDDFSVKPNGRPFTYCKECVNKYNRHYYYQKVQAKMRIRREHDKKIKEQRGQEYDKKLVEAYFSKR